MIAFAAAFIASACASVLFIATVDRMRRYRRG
jgi:hypothetical protein